MVYSFCGAVDPNKEYADPNMRHDEVIVRCSHPRLRLQIGIYLPPVMSFGVWLCLAVECVLSAVVVFQTFWSAPCRFCSRGRSADWRGVSLRAVVAASHFVSRRESYNK